jgi:site-specific DNA-methyltransferase (adenine-specific)
VLPTLVPGDVVLTDPPYDAKTHAGARTLGLASRARARDGQRPITGAARIEIDFDPADVSFTATLHRYCARWCVVFCALEMLGDYQAVAGEAWVRAGFWHRLDGAPQITGDRPGQPGEGLAILHRAGPKRWNGGGFPAFYSHGVVKHDRVHPTQKPESLMAELVRLYSDPGETIVDPYMGSGTTLVAAKRFGRKAIGIEVDQAYCALAVERLQQGALPLWRADDGA